jgi:zinc transporter ZupT
MNPLYFVLFVMLIFGSGYLAIFFKKNNKTVLKLLLSFTGAFILGIIFLHLMPVAYSGSAFSASLFILLGFFIQLLLEYLSKGVEHGHIHIHGKNKNRYAIQVLIGLCLHSLIEGFPLGEGMEHLGHNHHDHDHDHDHGTGSQIQLFWGIVAHHMPAAFALGTLFISEGFKRVYMILALLAFALMTPLGAYTAGLFVWSADGYRILICIVIGAFLHISTTILFEMDDQQHHHSISPRRLLAIAAGLLIAIVTTHAH